MKKSVLIVLGLVALLAIMIWADRKFPAHQKGGGAVANAPGAPNAPNATGGENLMPNLTMKDLSGRDIPLDQYKGKVVLVNFWATWCEPCKEEIPWMIEFQKAYGPRGFTVVGIAMDDDGMKAVGPFVEKQRFDVQGQKEMMDYPILLGNDSIADKFGGIMGLPTSMIYARDGSKLKTIIGVINHDDVSRAIQGML